MKRNTQLLRNVEGWSPYKNKKRLINISKTILKFKSLILKIYVTEFILNIPKSKVILDNGSSISNY